MPNIDELATKTKRKFQKSEYRPWNYMETIDQESINHQKEINKESLDNQKGIKEESIGNHAEIKKKPLESNYIKTEVAEEQSILENQTFTDVKREPLIKENVKKQQKKDLETNSEDSEYSLDLVFRLSGHQKKIFLLIVERCISRGMLTTGVIKGEDFTEITNTTSKMVKTSIQRLVDKQLIIRERGKVGRGGFYSFRITESIRNSALEYKRMLSIGNQSAINKESNENHGYKNAINKKQLPFEWEIIQISLLEEIGFKENHLMDIFETGNADPQVVQESILHFAYGLNHEPEKYKMYDDPLKVLIGKLRKGGNWFEKNYRSPKELAQQEFIQRKKIEMERIKKIEEEAYKLALSEWQDNLKDSESKLILEKKEKGEIMPPNVKFSLYFKENVWPDVKKNYLISDE